MAGIKTIDMQLMRYINLFRKISHVSTTNCFVYNNAIIFAVPRNKISIAIGSQGKNMRRIGEILRKKIKVIEMPTEDSQDCLKRFVESIVDPIGFNKFELKDGMAVVGAGRQSKAALIGRNRVREKELKDILSKTFKIGLRIS